MSVHSAQSIAFTAKRASVAVLREGPRLIALGKPAADGPTPATVDPRDERFLLRTMLGGWA